MSVAAREAKIENYQRTAKKVRPAAKQQAAEKVVNLFQRKNKSTGIGPRERERLVLEFRTKARKLARSILRKWHSRLDLNEVDSVVDLSLCEAVSRYNPNKGASFMTFLFYHLRGNLIRAVSAAATANVVPLLDQEELKNNDSKRGAFLKGANAIEVAEALCGHEYMLPDEILFKKELASMSTVACSKLDALEREVIFRIYIKEQQLMDIANSLGYSRCHISRVKKKALETLHQEMASSLHQEEEELKTQAAAEVERRKIHRRRPRSQKARLARERMGSRKLMRAAA